MKLFPTDDNDAGRSKAQRVARNYRRARRKLLNCRREGADAVAGYLVRSYLARRLAGLELHRPETVAPFDVTPGEVARYRSQLRAIEWQRAIAMGGELEARRIRLEDGLAKLAGAPEQELLRRIFALGGHQVVLFGFSNDTSRTITLLPGGGELANDGRPAAPIADLVRRAFRHVFTCVTIVRTNADETVNVYEAKSAEFHVELRKEIYAAVVANGQVAFMDAASAEESLAVDQRTMTPLPRVPGTVYCCWPGEGPAAKGEETHE